MQLHFILRLMGAMLNFACFKRKWATKQRLAEDRKYIENICIGNNCWDTVSNMLLGGFLMFIFGFSPLEWLWVWPQFWEALEKTLTKGGICLALCKQQLMSFSGCCECCGVHTQQLNMPALRMDQIMLVVSRGELSFGTVQVRTKEFKCLPSRFALGFWKTMHAQKILWIQTVEHSLMFLWTI